MNAGFGLLWKPFWAERESCSNTHPTFTCCMQNDVTTMLFCLSRHRKKTHMYINGMFNTKTGFFVMSRIIEFFR